MAVEDLSHTPAERAAAAAAKAAAGGGTEQDLADERAAFADAEEQTIGAGDGQHIIVIGAGLVGSLCAVMLRRKGFKVHVFERYRDPSSLPGASRRSINLSLSCRGLRAIRELSGGMCEDLLEKWCTRQRGRIVHMPGGETVFSPYGKDDSECLYSISRTDLNNFLMEWAQKEGVEYHVDHTLSDTSEFTGPDKVGCTLHFNRRGEDPHWASKPKFDVDAQSSNDEGSQSPESTNASDSPTSSDSDDSVKVQRKARYEFAGQVKPKCTTTRTKSISSTRIRVRALCPVIACDGAGSRVRHSLQRAGLLTCTEEVIQRGYKEVGFPNKGGKDLDAKGPNGEQVCDAREGVHIWPRGDHMLLGLANLDGSHSGQLYMDLKGTKESFEAFTDTPEGRERCAAFCEKHYADALDAVGGLDRMVRQITTNPTGLLANVRTSRWAVDGKVLLIGDACHAMVPFFAQGCNSGFEDTLCLSRFFDQFCCKNGQLAPELCTAENFVKCFAATEEERKPNAAAIHDMAMENFVELRDKWGDPRFQALKKVEQTLEATFRDKFRTRYAMVVFGGAGNLSYANAKHLGSVQWEIIEELCAGFIDEVALGRAVEEVDLERAEILLDQRLVRLHVELGVDLATVGH